MNVKENLFSLSVLISLVVLYCCLCCCSPVSYKEDTTTPKTFRDRFKFRKEHEAIPVNHSSNGRLGPFRGGFMSAAQRKKEADRSSSGYKVKAVVPVEKTFKQSDDDDDDDDDGGEYDGLENCADKGKKQEQHAKQESVPMMIIREVDMVAMEIPVKDCQKQKEQQEWTEWSSCSKPCGKGVQSRWRFRPGVQDREQQVRLCNVADCGNNDFLYNPPNP